MDTLTKILISLSFISIYFIFLGLYIKFYNKNCEGR